MGPPAVPGGMSESNAAMPAWLGLWWVHGPALAIALWMLWRDERLPRPRAVA